MADIVFLLGAGASRDAGLPLMAELTMGFKGWLTHRKEPEDLSHAVDLSLVSLFEAAVSAVAPEAGYPNIELVLQLLTDLLLFKSGAHNKTITSWHQPFDASPEAISSLMGVIREYIRETLSRAPASSGNYLSGLLDFGSKENPTVEVFTLNYDQLVESMAAQIGVRFTSGFGEAWDPSLFELKNWDLRLYKLHGSVDWYRLPSRNVLYRGSPEHHAFRGEESEEVLLYPARGKAAHADPFATLMSLFNRALADTRLCVAIGYSFRDDHIRRAVLDRMVTNKRLQLLIVDTKPELVMAVQPSDPHEPSFAQFRDSVFGLRMGAKQALQDRAITQRIDEIREADNQLSYVLGFRNRASFDQAASQLYSAIEYCRLHELGYKAVAYLGPQADTEFDKALVRNIVQQVAPRFKDQAFDSGPTAHIVQQVSERVARWVMAEALGVLEADAIRQDVGAVLMQYASNVVFQLNGEYRVWKGGRAFQEHKTMAEKRAVDLQALVVELNLHRPDTAFAVGGEAIRQAYETLKDGFEILAGYYRVLAQYALTVKPLGGHEVIIPDRSTSFDLMGPISERFLRSKAPSTWLPAAPVQGLVSDFRGLGLPQ